MQFLSWISAQIAISRVRRKADRYGFVLLKIHRLDKHTGDVEFWLTQADGTYATDKHGVMTLSEIETFLDEEARSGPSP